MSYAVGNDLGEGEDLILQGRERGGKPGVMSWGVLQFQRPLLSSSAGGVWGEHVGKGGRDKKKEKAIRPLPLLSCL